MTIPLADALTMSYDSSPNVRIEAAKALSAFGSEVAARDRLSRLLEDDVVQVEVAAAEWLLKRCGGFGLAPVLDELVERIDDPDTDYIRFMVLEVAATARTALLEGDLHAIWSPGTTKAARSTGATGSGLGDSETCGVGAELVKLGGAGT